MAICHMASSTSTSHTSKPHMYQAVNRQVPICIQPQPIQSYCTCLCCRYANTWKRHLWYRQQKHVSSKIAIDMSHYRLLERVAASNRSALILEDDAQLTGEQWLPDLLTALQELPQVHTSV